MHEKINILYAGSPHLAVPPLQSLLNNKYFNVVGVITPPPKPVGRKKVLTKSPVHVVAEENNIMVFHATKKVELLPIYKKTNPDLAVVVAFGVIFPQEVLDFCPLGTLNVHFSLLPHLRGASPVQSAILLGQKTSGITLQKMKLQLDAGDILYKKEYNIKNKSTSQLFTFFADETAGFLPEILQKYAKQEINLQPQTGTPTFCHKFTKADGEISKSDEKEVIWQKFLAFTPWPGIFLRLPNQKTLKLKEITLQKPEKEEALALQTKDGVIYVKKLQIEGKKAMSAQQFASGNTEIVDFLQK